MALNSGIDVISITRIRNAARSARFLERVFTRGELDYAYSKRDPHRHLAGRFAAKEACLKALRGSNQGAVSFKDIEVVKRDGGRPAITLGPTAKELLGTKKAHLSISYSGDIALAFVSIA
ncbi:MAG: holo-[acyl-carrier-protein] synthase [Deltaproteobacteria bacterium GWA2_55_10]|nr:MAG: holo-[acyl-carrier-protein] synthase [Deltaproteobacteria bacterium GWA2_55_10]